MRTKNIAANEFRIGLKSLYDVYPSKVREKITNDLKAKIWDEPQKKALATVSRDIDNFENNNSSSKFSHRLFNRLRYK